MTLRPDNQVGLVLKLHTGMVVQKDLPNGGGFNEVYGGEAHGGFVEGSDIYVWSN